MEAKQLKNTMFIPISLCLILGIVLLGVGTLGKQETSKEQSSVISLSEYESSLENKIKELCERVDGVTNVSVAVSLSSGGEYVYAKDGKDDYVLVGSGNYESGVLLSEKTPQISGIGIVCNFGGDQNVKYRLISLVSAACGVGSNKIFIAEAKK